MVNPTFLTTESIWEEEFDDGPSLLISGDEKGYDENEYKFLCFARSNINDILKTTNDWMLKWFLDPSKKEFSDGIWARSIKFQKTNSVIVEGSYDDAYCDWVFHIRYDHNSNKWDCWKFSCRVS